jgi:tetratricopeptide (TPR) repeat protein
MSHVKDIAQNSTAICVAALGLTATTGSVAIGAAGLIAIGLQLFKTHKATCKKAVEQVMKDIEKSGTESPDTLQAARDLLATCQDEVTVSRIDLPEAAQQEDFYSAVVEHLMQSFPEEADYNALQLIRLVMGHAFQACRYEEAFHRPLEQSLLTALRRDAAGLVRGQEKIRDDIAVMNAEVSRGNDEGRAALSRMEAQLLEQSRGAARQLHIQEGLLIALARRYAEGNPADFDGALAGLERALEVAAEDRERLPGNVSAAVEAVLARVEDLNAEGEIDAADDTLWDELQRAEEVELRLINKGLAQVVLTRNVDRAVALEIRRLALDGGAGFEALRGVRRGWYERGRDKGLRFDLEVAIALARESVKCAAGADQRGAATNDLGNALATLGERESGTERLIEAVEAFRAALLEYTRDHVPLNWAMTQNNLGVVEESFAAKTEGAARVGHLRAALAHIEAALQVFDPQASGYHYQKACGMRDRVLAALA